MRSLLVAAVLISAAAISSRAEDAPSPLTAPFDAAQAKAAQEAWAKYLGKSSPLEKNSIGMELVLIPPGKFTMGSPRSEKGRRRRIEDQVDVTLTVGFYLGKTEVTQGQWQAVMGTTPWEYVKEGANYPATYVSWDDAKAFCQKLSAKENTTYRLPTEAEWEYACRAGTTTRFSFGDAEGSLSDYAWWGGIIGDGNAKAEQYTHEVGCKRANPFGLYDMHGNVLEFCEDVYATKLPGGIDPLATAGGSGRVYRGGSWLKMASDCRSANRDGCAPGGRCDGLGFRVARVPVSEPD